MKPKTPEVKTMDLDDAVKIMREFYSNIIDDGTRPPGALADGRLPKGEEGGPDPDSDEAWFDQRH